MTTAQLPGQLDLLDMLAPAPAPGPDLPPLQKVLRPLTRLQDYAERYPHWLRIGEQCPACGFRFDYPSDASNNHGVPCDADPAAPVCTAMYLTRNHLINAAKRDDADELRRCIDRAERWWNHRLWDWLPQLLEEHRHNITDFRTPLYFFWKEIR